MISTKPLIAGETLINSGPQLIQISAIENVGELYQMTQDQQGFLYFASNNGLVRFDGYQTQTFMSEHQNQYYLIANGNAQSLWIAGTKGLSKFDLDTQSFSFYAQTDIYDMSVSGDQIWLATKQGIKYFDNKSQSIKPFENKTPIKQNIDFILITKDQQLWFTSRGKGAVKLNLNNQSYQVFNQQSVNDDKFSNLITALSITNNNQVWLGSDKGLHHYHENTNQFDFYQLPINSINEKNQYTITHIYQDKDNNIWVSTLQNGIVVKKHNQQQFIPLTSHNLVDSSLNPLFISQTFQDHSDTLWFITDDHTVLQLKRQALHFDNYTSNKAMPINLRAMHTDLSGKLWIGSDYSLFSHNSSNNSTSGKSTSDNSFKTVQQHIGYIAAIDSLNENTLLLAIAGKGLFNYDKTTNSLTPAFEPLSKYIVDSNFHSLSIDHKHLWVGLYYDQTPVTGLVQFDLQTGKINNHLQGYTIESTLLLDKWVIAATRRDGIHLFNRATKQWQQLSHNNIDLEQLWTTYQSTNSSIWLGTRNSGLVQVTLDQTGNNQHQFHSLTKDNGLPSNTIRAISEDQQGNLWLGTTNGIAVYHINSGKITSFNSAQGNKLANTYPRMAATISNGDILMTNRYQITQFNPQSLLTPVKRKFSLLLSDFRLFNQPQQLRHLNQESPLGRPINKTQAFSLNHQQFWFSFNFSSTLFDQAKNNRFAYKMTGLSDKWITTDHHNRTVSFTSIPAGNYQFELKTSQADGTWSETLRTIDITITPPWWQTPLAYSAYILALLLLGYSFYQIRTKQLIKRATILEGQVQQRTETINQLLTQKERMFANISHEFKTPLTLILSPLETINHQLSQEQLNSKIAMIKRNGKRLLNMVEQLLELSRLDSLEQSPKAHYEVKGAITTLLTAFEPLINDKNLKLNTELIDNVWGEFSFDALEIVLTNLISNAIKYTPEGGSISIGLNNDNQNMIITIEDTGHGISIENQGLIFNRFTRATDHHEEAIPGAGIGLALVKELVESNGGKITLISEINHGTVFTLTFPIYHIDDSSTLPQKQIDGLICAKQQQLDSAILETHTSIVSPEPTQNAENKPSILIVDDSADMLTLLQQTLEADYHLIPAENGQIALDKAKAEIPDLIISDVMMPIMNGYQLAQQLKQEQLTCHIPVVLLTAKGDMDARLEGWKQDIDDYLAKPFHPQELHLRIQSLLSIRQILRKRFSKEQLEQPMQQTIEQADVDNSEAEIITPVISDKDLAFIDKFKKVIEKNYHNPEFSREKAASDMAISDRQLHRKLNALIEENFTDYLRSYRLNTARDLLTTGIQIGQISDQVGFTSTAYFSRCFKAQFNKTPKQYQKELITG